MTEIKRLIARILSGKTRTTLALQQMSKAAVYRGINILVSFVYVPLLLHYLEPERYGIWLTLISTVTWIGVFDIGLGNGLRNKLTEALAVEDYKLARIYISTTYALLVCIFLPLAPIFYFLSHYISWPVVFNTSIIDQAELFFLVNIVFVFFCLRIVLKIIGAVFKAHQKPAMENFLIAVNSIMSLMSVFVLTKIQPEPDLVILGAIVSGIPVCLYFIFSLYMFKAGYKQISPSIRFVDFGYKNELLGLGAQFFVIQGTYIAIYSSYNILILHWFGSDEVVRFNVAFKLFSVPIMIYTIIQAPVWSAVTDAYVRNDFSWLKITLRRMNRLSVLMLGFVVIILVASDHIYQIWIGREIEVQFSLSAGLAIYAAIFVFAAPYSAFVNGFGKMRLTTSVSVINIILFFATAFVVSTVIDNSISVAVALCVTAILGFAIRYMQTNKILNRTAEGIWVR